MLSLFGSAHRLRCGRFPHPQSSSLSRSLSSFHSFLSSSHLSFSFRLSCDRLVCLCRLPNITRPTRPTCCSHCALLSLHIRPVRFRHRRHLALRVVHLVLSSFFHLSPSRLVVALAYLIIPLVVGVSLVFVVSSHLGFSYPPLSSVQLDLPHSAICRSLLAEGLLSLLTGCRSQIVLYVFHCLPFLSHYLSPLTHSTQFCTLPHLGIPDLLSHIGGHLFEFCLTLPPSR